MTGVDKAEAEGVGKFDRSRADEYGVQARIALAGYDACHELSACMLASILGPDRDARILVIGAGGTGQEVLITARLEPRWRFVAVDPSREMLEIAADAYEREGIAGRVQLYVGHLAELADDERYDAAILVGVIHHVTSNADKLALLRAISDRLCNNGPLILAGNRHPYASQPLLLRAWEQRWRLYGAGPEEGALMLARIQQGAVPPASDEAVAELLLQSGFGPPTLFFSSLFWGAWVARCGIGDAA